jgi:hypothetical protein
MFSTASEFTMQDQNSNPFAWMIENMEVNEVGNVEAFVRSSAKMAISMQNDSKAKDETVYKVWRSGREFNQACIAIEAMLKAR